MMLQGRRGFIVTSVAALVAVCAFHAAAEALPLKFGVLSDAHVQDVPGGEGRILSVFRHFSRAGVRAVAMTGDLCETGSLAELRRVRAAWDAAFPGGCNAAGEKVVPLVSWGNHDYHDASYQRNQPVTDEVRRTAIVYNKDEAWRILTDEPFPGEVWRRDVCGVTFLGAHWGHLDADFAAYLDGHAADIPADRPVFVLQHIHPKDTCFSPWGTYGSAANRAALAKHSNFFVMSGHSHLSVGFDDAIWCGGFVSMAAGCAANAVGRRYEYNWPHRDKDTGRVVETRMPKVNAGGTWQASVVEVRPSRVTVSRRDYLNDLPLGEDWELPFPFPSDPSSPLVLAQAAPAPSFPAGAGIAFERKDGKVYPDGRVERDQLHLHFPCARSTGPHSRAVDYRVTVTRKGSGAPLLERLVSQEGAALAEEAMARRFGGWCVFGPDELPRGVPLVFSVAPLNAAGKAGESIRKEIML